MEELNQADFEKIEKYLALMKEPYGGRTGNTGEQYQARQKAHDEAVPVANALIKYYYTEVNPDNGEKSEPLIGERPYNTTKTERALVYFKDMNGDGVHTFFDKYPDLLDNAIQHYQANSNTQLKKALETQLSQMTGSQLLLILEEYSSRKI
jgi:hypothetical protein